MAEQQQYTPEMNMRDRMILLQSGIAMNKRISVVKGGLNDTIKIPLLRMGIMTGVMLHFTVPVEITGTAVPSAVSPWNIAKRVVYHDFAQNERTRTNGFQLWSAQSMKQGDAMGVSPLQAQGVDLDYDTSIFHLPTAAGEDEIRFSLYVPMAYDANSDLTGAVLTQTNVGEHYITIQTPNALVGVDEWLNPYKSGDVKLSGDIKVEAFQFYIQPQGASAGMLPAIDLSTIYGFAGAYESSENIVTGQEKYIDLPNNRSIFSTLVSFQNGNGFTQNGADLNLISIIANSNTWFKEMTPRLVREIMRNMVNCDMPTGTYYLGSRRQPILTQLYANVQAVLDVKTVQSTGITKMISQFEVMYPSGAPLPGITIAA